MIQGKTIAITRTPEEAQDFINLMKVGGGIPIALPTIQVMSKGDKIVDEFLDVLKNDDPDFFVFLSSKAVSILFDSAKKAGKFEELQLAIANTTVMAVGPKTKATITSYGIRVAYMPERHSSVGIGEVICRLNAVGKKVLVPRSGASNSFLKDLLEKIGLQVIEIHMYDVCAFNNTNSWNEFRQIFSQSKVDGIIFTSASSVDAFFEIMKKDYDEKTLQNTLKKMKLVSIGPFTSEALGKFELEGITSDVHTIEGAFETIKNSLG